MRGWRSTPSPWGSTHLHPGGKSLDVSGDKAIHVQTGARAKCLDHESRDSPTMGLSPASFVNLLSPLKAEVLKCPTVWICPRLSLRSVDSELASMAVCSVLPWTPSLLHLHPWATVVASSSHHALKVILPPESNLDWRSVPSSPVFVTVALSRVL